MAKETHVKNSETGGGARGLLGIHFNAQPLFGGVMIFYRRLDCRTGDWE